MASQHNPTNNGDDDDLVEEEFDLVPSEWRAEFQGFLAPVYVFSLEDPLFKKTFAETQARIDKGTGSATNSLAKQMVVKAGTAKRSVEAMAEKIIILMYQQRLNAIHESCTKLHARQVLKKKKTQEAKKTELDLKNVALLKAEKEKREAKAAEEAKRKEKIDLSTLITEVRMRKPKHVVKKAVVKEEATVIEEDGPVGAATSAVGADVAAGETGDHFGGRDATDSKCAVPQKGSAGKAAPRVPAQGGNEANQGSPSAGDKRKAHGEARVDGAETPRSAKSFKVVRRGEQAPAQRAPQTHGSVRQTGRPQQMAVNGHPVGM